MMMHVCTSCYVMHVWLCGCLVYCVCLYVTWPCLDVAETSSEKTRAGGHSLNAKEYLIPRAQKWNNISCSPLD